MIVGSWGLPELDEPPGHVVAILSGGLDSTTMGFALRAAGSRLSVVSFDYGQRHRTELAAARAVAARLGAPHEVIDLRSVGALLTGSALTDTRVDVPRGHYTDESMRCTVVPNRNAIMLDIATGIALARGADAVAFGAHGGDHPIYPDCRPEFVVAFTEMVRVANVGFISSRFQVMAPFLSLTKSEIVGMGARLGVPFELTWSCYEGGTVHCGQCGACAERREAFSLAGVHDPTNYAIPTWSGDRAV
ncbi:MAG: 7-cyano-7-deazaguanine synthase QueC [Pseudonocardiaceae bacterium]